ncbi:trichohyalin-like [Macrobrachium nipponense]|uniref:trichohyalin-like n=1 Tax=Macrobrachium nipponense TaxID=159736 RepID=UPI0030C816F5
MFKIRETLCTLFGLVGGCEPAPRITQEFVSLNDIIIPSPEVADGGCPVTDGGWPTGVASTALVIGRALLPSVGLYIYNKWCIHRKRNQQEEAVAETTTRLELPLGENDFNAQVVKEMERKIRAEFEEDILEKDKLIEELANKLEEALRQEEKMDNLLAIEDFLLDELKCQDEKQELKQLLKERDVIIQEAEERQQNMTAEFEEKLLEKDTLIEDLANKLEAALRQEEKMDNLLAKEQLLEEELDWKYEKQELEHQIQATYHLMTEMEKLLEEKSKSEKRLESCLRTLEEDLLNRDRQIEDLLYEERTWKYEKQELEHQIKVALQHGKEMENCLEIAKARASEMDRYLASLEDYEAKLRDCFAVEVKKRDEKIQEIADKLEAAFHYGKEIESFAKKEKARADELDRYANSLREFETNLRDSFAAEVTNRDRKIEEMASKLEATLHYGKEMENFAKKEKARADELDRYVISLREFETKLRDSFTAEVKNRDKKIEEMASKLEATLHQGEEMEHLLEECKILKVKCKTYEENMIQEQKRVRERQRLQQEALMNQDRYMLTTLLHGIAKRNFHLEQIALRHDSTIVETICERDEKQWKEHYRAQHERNDYKRNWEVLIQMLEDIITGDAGQQKAKNRKSEIAMSHETQTDDPSNDDMKDETCGQNPEHEMLMNKHLTAKT